MKVLSIVTALGMGTFSLTAVAKDKTMANKPMAKTETMTEISLADLKTAIDAKSVFLMDANGAESFNKEHIPGAIDSSMAMEQLKTMMPQDKNAKIVAYCGGPMCQKWQDAAKTAKDMGYTQVMHFKGGLQAWKEAKYELTASSAATPAPMHTEDHTH